MNKIKDIERHFWTRVDRSDGIHRCWLWLAALNKDGYGRFRLLKQGEYKEIGAHRFAYEIIYGPVPENFLVCHNCPGGDNPSCVNPAHLWLGTNSDNLLDASRKGTIAKGDRNGTRLYPERLAWGDRNFARMFPERVRRGEQVHNAKLTEDAVKSIRKEYIPQFVSAHILARRYGVSIPTIKDILRRRSWKHV